MAAIGIIAASRLAAAMAGCSLLPTAPSSSGAAAQSDFGLLCLGFVVCAACNSCVPVLRWFAALPCVAANGMILTAVAGYWWRFFATGGTIIFRCGVLLLLLLVVVRHCFSMQL